MAIISLDEFHEDPKAFLARVEAGEPLVIFRDERAIIDIRPIPIPIPPHGKRPYGLGAGHAVVPDDFDAPLPEDVLKDFYGQ